MASILDSSNIRSFNFGVSRDTLEPNMIGKDGSCAATGPASMVCDCTCIVFVKGVDKVIFEDPKVCKCNLKLPGKSPGFFSGIFEAVEESKLFDVTGLA